MTQAAEQLTPAQYQRVIGRIEAETPGPTLVCVGGLHGNEPAGVIALQRVFRSLGRDDLIRGQILGLAGNLAALARGSRYLDSDLNRHWTGERIQSLDGDRDGSQCAEDAELSELLQVLRRTESESPFGLHVLDLHTTSGFSAPFGTIGDTLRNRSLAQQFPIPIILGLEENLDGTFLSYVDSRGHATMGLEGGKHDDPRSTDNLEAGVWTMLGATNMIPPDHPELSRARRTLEAAGAGLPRVLEVRYRRPVRFEGEFRMRPGFASFQTVRAGQVLAESPQGDISAPMSGLILMPLYQSQGEDGFFIVREFSPAWLRISAFLRNLRFDSLLRWLPGVSRDPEHSDSLVVDLRVARFYSLQIFHLFGYRKLRQRGRTLMIQRRKDF